MADVGQQKRAAATAARIGCRQPGARRALLTLAGVNLLNFADRYVASSVKELVKEELDLTDYQTALPTTGMAVVYMIFAAIFGSLADRNIADRRKVMAFGVLLWSVATALAGFAENLPQLVFFRSLVGVGEAAYGVVSLPMLCDFYPRHERTMAFAIYNLSSPVGGALGYGLGASLGAVLGWRHAFLIVGVPGVLVSLALLTLRDPLRGASEPPRGHSGPVRCTAHVSCEDDGESCADSSSASQEGGAARAPSSPRAARECCTESDQEAPPPCLLTAYWSILTTGHWLSATMGLVAVIFSIGGLADWIESFLQRYKSAELAESGIVVGAITAIAGILGNVIGANVVQAMEPNIRNAGLLMSAVFAVPAAAFGILMLNTPGDRFFAYAMLLGSETCLWTHMAPISATSISSIPINLRATASGLQILLCHVLGDVISPPIIGVISDRTNSLRDGMQLTWVAILGASVAWGIGATVLPPLSLADGGPEGGKGSWRPPPTTMRSLFARDDSVAAGGFFGDSDDDSLTPTTDDDPSENYRSE